MEKIVTSAISAPIRHYVLHLKLTQYYMSIIAQQNWEWGGELVMGVSKLAAFQLTTES